MNWARLKTPMLAGTVVVVIAIAIVCLRKPAAREERQLQTKIAASLERINEANAGLPDPQIQAKALIFAAMIQKRIPAAGNWCDTLNAGNKLWPVRPTNTVFALNAPMAGRVYAKGIPGDAVVFFETGKPGWNRVGGRELLARKPEGVAVALMDGRAMLVSPDEAASLQWAP